MNARLLPGYHAASPPALVFGIDCRRAFSYLLVVLTLNTLYGCAILRGGDHPVLNPQSDPAKPEITPGEPTVDLPGVTPAEPVSASTDPLARPIIDARCDFNSELDVTIKTLAEELTQQEIPYALGGDSAGEWRDCSGVFLRFSSALAESCPMLESQLAAAAGVKAYERGADNLVKGVEKRGQRTTRTIAAWYHTMGGFTPVVYASPKVPNMAVTDQDVAKLVAIRDQIKVGSVLWFSRHKPQPGEDIQSLFSNHINHMGVVTEVIPDENGILKQYKMFHGHGSENNPARTTVRHFWDWHSTEFTGPERYPPLGYWAQYLVGISPVFSGHTDDITLSAN